MYKISISFLKTPIIIEIICNFAAIKCKTTTPNAQPLSVVIDNTSIIT